MNDPGHEASSPLTVTSPDPTGGAFLREFTCDGANRRPRLEWSTPPPGTLELAIEMLDPDAPGGTFTHWLAYRIPPGTSSLAAVPAGAAEGVNDSAGAATVARARRAAPRTTTISWSWRWTPGWGLAAGATRPELESRMRGHVLGRGELVASYQRR